MPCRWGELCLQKGLAVGEAGAVPLPGCLGLEFPQEKGFFMFSAKA